MPFIALYLAVFLLMTGIGLLGTYLPLRLTLEGASTQVVGAVMSAYFFGLFIGAQHCQRLISSVGHIRSFTAFASLTAAVVLLHGLFVAPAFWALLRFLAGLSTIGIYTVIESWLNECTDPQSRGRVLSIYMVISYLGMVCGQLLLNLGNPQSLQIFSISGLFLALCIVPVAVTHGIHPEAPRFERFNVLVMLRRSPTGMLGCLTAGMLNSAFYSITPVFCHRAGFTVGQLSMVMTATILGGLLLQWPMGSFSDRFDRTYVLSAISLSIALLAVAIAGSAGLPFAVFLLSMGMFGGLIFTVYPVSVARAHDLFSSKDIVAVSSALLLYYGMGASVGPILASAFMTRNPYGFFFYCAFVALFFGAIAFYLRRREMITVIPVEKHVQFVAMKSTSPVAVMIDPRSDLEGDGADPSAGGKTNR